MIEKEKTPMRKIHFVFLLATLFLTNYSFANADKAINVAIIADKASGLDKSPLVSLLEVELSKLENVKLLERSEIEKILAEKKLQLSFEASENESRIQIGNILGADLILFMKKIIGPEKQEFIDARIVETRTGVILDDVLQDISDIEKDIQVLIKATSPGLLKANVPLSQRHYLGISDIRNEEPGRELNPIATALTQLLKHDLNSSKNIIVLEREQLNYLLNERNLAGVNVQLKASTIILEGGIRRNGSTKEYSVSIKFIEPSGGKTKDAAINVPSSDIAVIRQEICKAVISALDDTAEFKISGDSHAEAAYFLQRALSSAVASNSNVVTSFAETALALDEDNLDLRDKIYHSFINIARYAEVLSEADRLKACKRAHEIDLGTMERITRLGTKYVPNNIIWYLFQVYPNGYATSAKPNYKEILELLSEIHAICLKKYDLLHDLYLKENKDSITLLVSKMKYISEIYDTPEQFSQNVKVLVTEFEKLSKNNFIMFYEDLATNIDPDIHKVRNEKIFPLFEWLRQSSDPTLKMLGYFAMVDPEIPDNGEAENMCKLILLEGAEDVRSASSRAVRKLNKSGKLEGYFENIMKLAENGQKEIIFKNTEAVKEFISYAGNEKKIEWCRRIQSMLDTYQVPSAKRSKIKEFQLTLDRYLVKKDESDNNNIGPWVNYTITPVPIFGRDPKIQQRLVWVQVDKYNKKIFLFWRGPVKKREQDISLYDYIVTNIDAKGGQLKQIGKIENLKDSSIKCSDNSSNNVFLGTSDRGLITISPDGIETFGEAQGCPSNEIFSMAYLDDILYLGFYGSFAKFDPKNKSFYILASSKAVLKKNELESESFSWVSSMISNSKYNALWFTAVADRGGIWKYDPTTGMLNRVGNPGSITSLASIDNEEILFAGGLLNPQTDEIRRLIGYHSIEEYFMRAYYYKCCVMIGKDIFGAPGRLFSDDHKIYDSSNRWNMMDYFDTGFIAAKYGDNVNELWFVQPKEKVK